MSNKTESILDWLNAQEISQVKIGITDIDGVLRTKYLAKEKVIHSLENGFGFCNVVFGWDLHDQLYPKVLDAGFADDRVRLIPTSRRNIPWENAMPFLLGDFSGGALANRACPRSVLSRVVAKAEAMGFTAQFGPEYEWFVYQESPQSAAKKDYHQLERITPGMFGYSGLRSSQNHTYFNDLFKQLGEFGVALEGLHTETGPGVLEAALMYQPALEAADRAILFKQGVKEISYRHGFLASFMAKPTKELPGCGGHLHQSLWQNGHNVFYDGNAPDGMSPLFRHYLAGQLALLPKLFPLFAPTVNSYKRYVAGSWAATHVSWGIDNRTVALRVISGEEKATRLETRVPGADANPYLAIAAALAAGLYGIEHALPLNSTAVVGSAYESSLTQRLPSHLQAATLALKNSEVVAGLLGKEFIDHFVRSREWEWQQYQLAVTDWERARYLELI